MSKQSLLFFLSFAVATVATAFAQSDLSEFDDLFSGDGAAATTAAAATEAAPASPAPDTTASEAASTEEAATATETLPAAAAADEWEGFDYQHAGLTQSEFQAAKEAGMSRSKLESLLEIGISPADYLSKPWTRLGVTEEKWL
jgi:hypothetical protein